ncbi:elongation factor P 5-aminopentanone reductase [Salsuginibacillus kocurii]|uniref:elongation factor P 5-aminopentanone reductase n=1 Tax=Salsuginibacillus kocurii TaxID=427078 RepID=UPI000368F37C|nr:SDR family oxidoreductase [Salsuginibacillus kocurii]
MGNKVKWVLVTGASGGVGQAVARTFAKEGNSLLLHYNQNEKKVRFLLDECKAMGVEALPIQADLSSERGLEKLLEEIHVNVHTVVHTGGTSPYGLFTDVSAEEFQKTLQLHLISPMRLTQQLLPSMIREQAGRVIVISSIWGDIGASCEVIYSSVKGGLNSFVRSLGKEVAPTGITVNGVAPGAVDTPMMERFSTEEKEALKSEIPAGRFAAPDEVAAAVSFLASEQAGYVNGHILNINGAWI